MCIPATCRDDHAVTEGNGNWQDMDTYGEAEEAPGMAPQTLDVSQAACYLGITDRFVRKLIEQRRIAFLKVGRLVRFRADDLDAYLDSCRVEALDPVASRRRRR